MFSEKVFLLFCFITLATSFPVAQEVTVEVVKPELTTEVKANAIKSPKQDEDGGGGEDGAAAAAGGLDGIGNNLSQIASGVTSGNLGSIFGGSASFISDSGTRTAVTGLLSQLSKTLNQIISSGLSQLTGGANRASTQRSVTAAPAS